MGKMRKADSGHDLVWTKKRFIQDSQFTDPQCNLYPSECEFEPVIWPKVIFRSLDISILVLNGISALVECMQHWCTTYLLLHFFFQFNQNRHYAWLESFWIRCDVKGHTSIFSLHAFYLRSGFINLCVNKVLRVSSISFYDSNYFNMFLRSLPIANIIYRWN
jgi:hypothetical protein